MLRITGIALLLGIITGALGCAGGGTGSQSRSVSDPPPSSTSVVITPNGIGQVWQGTKVQFSAVVSGQKNQAVTWSIREGNNGGTIDSTGLYTAPSVAGTFHVIATSQADPTASGIASVEVPPDTVSIHPANETLRVGGQRLFSGFVLAADQRVTWSLKEGAAGGNIAANGLYTAPSTTGTFHLVATSVFSPNASATAPIVIVDVGFAPIANMAVVRSGQTATLLADGRVLVAGGTTDAAKSAELFVPASGSFSLTASAMVHVRTGHCASLLPDGKVLIAGGTDSSGNLLKAAELFDPATQTFVATGDMSDARRGATATQLASGKVLIAGGQDSTSTSLSSAEMYDPATGSFTLTGSMSSSRAQQTATLLSNGKVLFVGGVGGHGSIGTAEIFDPASRLFSATGSLIQPRAHHTATLLPTGKVLVLGGAQIMPPGGGGAPPAPVSLDSAEIYDPAKGAFETTGELLTARDSHSATLLPNGMVLVAGGYIHDFDGDAQSEWYTIFTAELFDPISSVSTAAASLVTDRAEHVATMLNGGQVLITGGISGYQELCCIPKPVFVSLASAELYK